MTAVVQQGAMTTSEAIELALWWAEQGLPAFPVAGMWDAAKYDGAGGIVKAPLTAHGFLDATTDRRELEAMFERATPPPGGCLLVGVVPGAAGFVVLDCDTKGGRQGLETLERLTAEHGEFAKYRYETPSGGLNVVCRKPAGITVGNHSPWDGIDIRSDAGYIVAPGSRSPWGDWREVFGEIDDAVEVPPAMARLLREAAEARPAASVAEARAWLAENAGPTTPTVRELVLGYLDEFRQSASGSRHGALVTILGRIVGLEHLDHAKAFIAVRKVWDELTAGERREHEPLDVLLWVIAQERAKAKPGAVDLRGSRDGALTEPEPPPQRPTLAAAAFHGPIGEFVQAAAPHTEADPAAILASLLVGFGVSLHRGPHMLAGNDRHPCALDVVVVGATAKARKGTSWGPAREVLARAELLGGPRVLGGFGSGESFIDAVRDKADDDDKDAPADTRAVVFESEFARILHVVGRDGSTLGQNIRDAWDGRPLQARSRGKGTVVATGYHVGLVAHITTEELRSALTSTEIYGGTGNRMLWVYAERTRRLPNGGNVPDALIDRCAGELRKALELARKVGQVRRTPGADELWRRLYDEMADDDCAGLVGALTARAEAQVLRLGLVYALASRSQVVDVEHLEAAWALWCYSRDTVDHVFADALGDPTADRILSSLHSLYRQGTDGVTRTEIVSNALAGHTSKREMDRALERLKAKGLVVTERRETGGRPAEVVRLSDKAKEAKEGRR